MNKIDLKELADLTSVSSKDKVLGYNPTAKKFGFVGLSTIINEGYACRRWDVTKSTTVGEPYGNIDYLRNLPSLLALGCYLVDNNHGRRKLDPTNHYKFATGETARLDGSMGHYMWGWGVKWYYAFWDEGNYHYESASLKPIPGRYNYEIPVASTSALGVSVVDRESLKLVSYINDSAQYRGGTNDESLDGSFNSYLGMAATNLTAEEYGSYARKNGEGWEAYWYTMAACVGILIRIIHGERNAQKSFNANKDSNGLYQGGFGAGVTGGWPTSFKERPFLKTNVGVSLADSCGVQQVEVRNSGGSVEKTYNVPCFFGLKNFFGYLGRWERGCLINKISGGAGDVYVVPKVHSSYNMNSLSGLKKVSTVPSCAVANQWEFIQKISMNNLCHKPTLTGSPATESTYYADAFYNDNSSSGLRVPCLGGSANAGGISGPECLHVSFVVSARFAYVGSPLGESEENWSSEPFLAI